MKSSVGVIKSSGKKIVHLLLTYSFGAVRLGFGEALMKILLFVCYSAAPILVIWKFGLTGYNGYFLMPMTIWMLGGFWAFFDLPVNAILRESSEAITGEIEKFISEQGLTEKEEFDLLENQLEKLSSPHLLLHSDGEVFVVFHL